LLLDSFLELVVLEAGFAAELEEVPAGSGVEVPSSLGGVVDVPAAKELSRGAFVAGGSAGAGGSLAVTGAFVCGAEPSVSATGADSVSDPTAPPPALDEAEIPAVVTVKAGPFAP
jgi:hypothetical protein